MLSAESVEAESEDGKSVASRNDLDSDVSFEEEDWVECIKRSTIEAMEKMKMRR